MSCTVAHAMARSNSIFRLMCPMDTIVLVIEVPMFAPMMMGTAIETLSVPLATKPTTIAVVVELDCTMLVARIPIRSAENGFRAYAMSASENPFYVLKESPINWMLTKKI